MWEKIAKKVDPDLTGKEIRKLFWQTVILGPFVIFGFWLFCVLFGILHQITRGM